MNRNHILVSSSIGIFAGLLVGASTQGKLGTFLITLAASSIPTGLIAHIATDSRYRPKLERAESNANQATANALKAENSFKEIQKKSVEVTGHYTTLHAQYKVLETENKNDKNKLSETKFQLTKLNEAMELAKLQISELTHIKEGYEVDWRQMEEEKEQVNAREIKLGIRKAQKEEIQRLWNIADEDCQNFLKCAEDATELMLVFKEKADGAKAMALSIGESARKFRDEKNKQIDNLVEQIEIKNTRIGLLQQRLNGDLIEPSYGQFGYQWDARIVDDIARHIWTTMQIPLVVKGYKSNPDGSAIGGYSYSRSQSAEALVGDLSRLSGDIAKALGIHAIISIQKHDLSDLLIISWRCERPDPVSEEVIYRLMQPAKNCSQVIRDAMNHRKGGKPTLRVMSATGGGKGIVTKAFIADWVKSMSGEVWLSDPMDGSSEDFWECSKAAKSAREGSKLLSEFSSEFRARKDKQSQHKEVLVLGVFDEFDKQHPDSDKEKVQEIWTAIRHHNMNLILVGQSSEVGVNGWTWDAMKNCALLFVGNAITTATKQAKNIGISAANKRTIERDYDTIKTYLETKNEGLDSDVMYRAALLIVDDTYKFLELPAAYKGAITNDKAQLVEKPWQTSETEVIETTNEVSRPTCPVCGSNKVRKSKDRWRCENKEHTKEMGVKSWSVANS